MRRGSCEACGNEFRDSATCDACADISCGVIVSKASMSLRWHFMPSCGGWKRSSAWFTEEECVELGMQACGSCERILAQQHAALSGHTALKLLDIIRDLVSDEDCELDHRGLCVAHGWMNRRSRCPHARGKAALK